MERYFLLAGILLITANKIKNNIFKLMCSLINISIRLLTFYNITLYILG